MSKQLMEKDMDAIILCLERGLSRQEAAEVCGTSSSTTGYFVNVLDAIKAKDDSELNRLLSHPKAEKYTRYLIEKKDINSDKIRNPSHRRNARIRFWRCTTPLTQLLGN